MKDRIFMIEQKDIFTVKEAARYLTVSPQFVYNLIKDGQLDAINVGRRYKIKADAIIRYTNKDTE